VSSFYQQAKVYDASGLHKAPRLNQIYTFESCPMADTHQALFSDDRLLLNIHQMLQCTQFDQTLDISTSQAIKVCLFLEQAERLVGVDFQVFQVDLKT